jgi:hypothetical protein
MKKTGEASIKPQGSWYFMTPIVSVFCNLNVVNLFLRFVSFHEYVI